MAIKLKVRKVGNSLGVILPKEALTRLQVEEGQELILSESPEGFRVTKGDEEFARKMAVVQDLSHRYRNTLRELAKRSSGSGSIGPTALPSTK